MMAGQTSGDRHQAVKYVYELPYTERKMLCSILDMDNQWERLGGQFMNFKVHELYEMRRVEKCGESPCDRLLQAWGHQNNTVASLYSLLYKMHHYQAMRVLLPFIPSKYHGLALRGEQSLTAELPKATPGTASSTAQLRSLQQASLTGPAAPHSLPQATAPRADAAGLPKPPQHLLSSSRRVPAPTAAVSHQSARATTFQYGHNLDTGAPAAAVAPTSQTEQLNANKVAVHKPALGSKKIVNTDFSEGCAAAVSCEENTSVPAQAASSTHHHDFDAEYREKMEAQLAAAAAVDDRSHSTRVSSGGAVAAVGGSGGSGSGGGGGSNTSSCGGGAVGANNKVTVVAASEESTNDNSTVTREGGDQPESNAASRAPSAGGRSLSPNVPVSEPSSSPSNTGRPAVSLSSVSVLSECSTSPSVPVIAYSELAEATEQWQRSNLLGRGGFGSVYRGTWKNTEVAVKRIHPHGETVLGTVPLHINQTLEELRLLQTYRHDNILQLYGCSADAGQPACLVYQFMINGSVEDKLQGRRVHRPSEGDSSVQVRGGASASAYLDWWQRLNVARGTARALQFLHTVKEKPLIHGDIKSANILLDCNYEPKLGDFGLAREGPMSQYTSMKVSRVHGTRPYIPEEYLRDKKLSTKVDCYSYGVVLFELCTGLRAYDEKRQHKFLKELVCSSGSSSSDCALQDPKAGYDAARVFPALLSLGKECVVRAAKKRPDMAAVYARLQQLARHDLDVQHKRMSQGSLASQASSLYAPGQVAFYQDTVGSLPMPSTSPCNLATPYHTTNPFPSVQYPTPHQSLVASPPSSNATSMSPSKSPSPIQHHHHHQQQQHHAQQQQHHHYHALQQYRPGTSAPPGDYYLHHPQHSGSPNLLMKLAHHHPQHQRHVLQSQQQRFLEQQQLLAMQQNATGPRSGNPAAGGAVPKQQHLIQQQHLQLLQQQALQKQYLSSQRPLPPSSTSPTAASPPMISVSPPSVCGVGQQLTAATSAFQQTSLSSLPESALPDISALSLHLSSQELSAAEVPPDVLSKQNNGPYTYDENRRETFVPSVGVSETQLPITIPNYQRNNGPSVAVSNRIPCQIPADRATAVPCIEHISHDATNDVMFTDYSPSHHPSYLLQTLVNSIVPPSQRQVHLQENISAAAAIDELGCEPSESEAVLPMLTVLGNKSGEQQSDSVSVRAPSSDVSTTNATEHTSSCTDCDSSSSSEDTCSSFNKVLSSNPSPLPQLSAKGKSSLFD